MNTEQQIDELLQKALEDNPDECEHDDPENGFCLDCGEYIKKWASRG